MATSKKSYRYRVCIDCGEEDWVRTDSKRKRCRECKNKGELHYAYGKGNFTGSMQEYKKYHARVYRARGYANSCINGCTHTRYEWANISGNYDDINDYQQMCATCHRNFDHEKWGE